MISFEVSTRLQIKESGFIIRKLRTSIYANKVSSNISQQIQRVREENLTTNFHVI